MYGSIDCIIFYFHPHSLLIYVEVGFGLVFTDLSSFFGNQSIKDTLFVSVLLSNVALQLFGRRLVQREHLLTEVAAGGGLGKPLSKFPDGGSEVDNWIFIGLAVVLLHQGCSSYKGLHNPGSVLMSSQQMSFQIRGCTILGILGI